MRKTVQVSKKDIVKLQLINVQMEFVTSVVNIKK
jgi:hypothetical protein